MIHAASRAALTDLRQRLDEIAQGADAGALSTLARELYSVADLLVAQPRLRRSLGDPSTDAAGRTNLVGSVLGGKVGESTLSVVTSAVGLRWSSPWDLTDAIELVADDALFIAAEKERALDTVEDELFRFERTLDANPNLAATLDEASASGARRAALVRQLVGGKAHRITQELLEHAVASSRKRTVQHAIDDLIEAAVARRNKSLAKVTSAAPLTDEQETRLGEALTNLYGRPIAVRTEIDPKVKGGLVVRVGDEVIDASIAGRITAARAGITS